MQLLVSFLLPLDRAEAADPFFKDPKDKLALWGQKSSSEHIRTHAARLTKPEAMDHGGEHTWSINLVNMRMYNVEGEILRSLVATVSPPEVVREKMMAKASKSSPWFLGDGLTSFGASRWEKLPTRSYLCLHSKSDASDRAIEDMVYKVINAPDITAGPVLAEKKRMNFSMPSSWGSDLGRRMTRWRVSQ